MKNIYFTILIQILAFSAAFATSNHIIDIEGDSTGWAIDETFTNCSAANHAYFTWDNDNIYFGITDIEADFDNMATFVYFDSDPTGSNGSTDAYTWGDNITTPFKADYVLIFKNGLTNPNDYLQFMHYNNSTMSWEQLYDTTGSLFILDGTDTVFKFNMSDDYREIKVNRSYIGNPDAIKTCMFTEQQWGSYWRYFTWPSNDWVDAGRASGQAIPHYYGFLLEDGIAMTDAPYFDANITIWTGATDSNWSTASNWSNSEPNSNALALLPTTSNVEVDNTERSCYDISIKSGSVLTLSSNNSLTIEGSLFNHQGSSGLLIQSTAGGNGSVIVKGNTTGEITADCYTTASKWHSFATPVTGQTTSNLFLNHSPEVWLTEYDEHTKSYTFISSLTKALGDMKGWMLWLGGTTDHTFSFEGNIREDTIGSSNNMVRTVAGDYGFNYVGNPFTSAIDWDAATGWTKTNINNAIYIYNSAGTGNNWATYVGGVGLNGGSQYIAMNQGFFVQVTDGAGSYPEYGTLKMDNDVCVHNNVGYLKTTSTIDNLIRLQIEQDNLTDETVVRFLSEATDEFDGQFDAYKFFSYSDDSPMIFSSLNNNLSINSLPLSTSVIPIDVIGLNGVGMTISATEINNFTNIFLLDRLTGVDTDLSKENYSFIYDDTFSNRFRLHTIVTDVNDVIADKFLFTAFSSRNKITIKFSNNDDYEVSIINLLGQTLHQKNVVTNTVSFPISKSGYYIVKVSNNGLTKTKKIIIQ